MSGPTDLPGYRDLSPVFQGPMPEAMVVQAALGARGIDARLEDLAIKTTDPFITGGNALAVTVLVPAADLAEAEEVLRESRREAAAAAEDAEPVAGDEGESRLDRLSARVRWATCAAVTIPIAAVLGAVYLLRAPSVGERPRWHRVTVLCAWFSLATTALYLLGVMRNLVEDRGVGRFLDAFLSWVRRF